MIGLSLQKKRLHCISFFLVEKVRTVRREEAGVGDPSFPACRRILDGASLPASAVG